MTESIKKAAAGPPDYTLLTRRHFARLGVRCVRDAINGKARVNDLASYVTWRREGIRAALRGEYDHSFTHRQYRNYLETGVCVPLFAPTAAATAR